MNWPRDDRRDDTGMSKVADERSATKAPVWLGIAEKERSGAGREETQRGIEFEDAYVEYEAYEMAIEAAGVVEDPESEATDGEAEALSPAGMAMLEDLIAQKAGNGGPHGSGEVEIWREENLQAMLVAIAHLTTDELQVLAQAASQNTDLKPIWFPASSSDREAWVKVREQLGYAVEREFRKRSAGYRSIFETLNSLLAS